MKKGMLVFLCGAALYALEPGKNYDFYQKNGQNVLGAELLHETETDYVVKLKYVPKPLKLGKANLGETPVLSKVQPKGSHAFFPPLRRDFVLNASAGFSYLTFGDLGRIFRFGYEARLGADWLLFEKPFYRLSAISVLATVSNFQNDARRILTASVFAGPKFLVWHFESTGISVFASPLIGLSYVSLRGYTFGSGYSTVSAIGIMSFEKRWRGVVFAAQLYVNSLFDSSLNFSSSGISLAAQYPIGAAQQH